MRRIAAFETSGFDGGALHELSRQSAVGKEADTLAELLPPGHGHRLRFLHRLRMLAGPWS